LTWLTPFTAPEACDCVGPSFAFTLAAPWCDGCVSGGTEGFLFALDLGMPSVKSFSAEAGTSTSLQGFTDLDFGRPHGTEDLSSLAVETCCGGGSSLTCACAAAGSFFCKDRMELGLARFLQVKSYRPSVSLLTTVALIHRSLLAL